MENGQFTPEDAVEASAEGFGALTGAMLGLSERDLYNLEWVRRKREAHHENVRLLHQQRWRGTMYIHGVGQTR